MIRSAIFSALISFSLICCSAAQAKEESLLETGVRDIVSDTVSAGQDFMSAVKEGFDEGRQGKEKLDRSRLVAGPEDLKRLKLTMEVVKVEELSAGRFQVTVALRNPNDFMVRLVNLERAGNVVLLDKDGFASALADPAAEGREVDVLGRSAARLRFTFVNVENRPATFRLYNTDTRISRW